MSVGRRLGKLLAVSQRETAPYIQGISGEVEVYVDGKKQWGDCAIEEGVITCRDSETGEIQGFYIPDETSNFEVKAIDNARH